MPCGYPQDTKQSHSQWETAQTVDVLFEKYESFCQTVFRIPRLLYGCLLIHQQIICHCKDGGKRGFLCHAQLLFWPVYDSMMEMKPSISEIRSRPFFEGQFSLLLIAITRGQIETITMGLESCSHSHGQLRWRRRVKQPSDCVWAT